MLLQINELDVPVVKTALQMYIARKFTAARESSDEEQAAFQLSKVRQAQSILEQLEAAHG